MVNRHVWLDIELNIIFGQQSIWPIRWNLNPVWPVKSRQMSIKVAQKWFHNKNEIFGHLYQNWLKCGRFGLNNCCHRLKKLPRVPKIAQYCHTAWIQHLFFFRTKSRQLSTSRSNVASWSSGPTPKLPENFRTCRSPSRARCTPRRTSSRCRRGCPPWPRSRRWRRGSRTFKTFLFFVPIFDLSKGSCCPTSPR